MKIRTRIVVALAAAFASVFVAGPALASEPHIGVSQYSAAGTPLDYVAISIVMLVLLVGILAGSTLTGSLFDKKE